MKKISELFMVNNKIKQCLLAAEIFALSVMAGCGGKPQTESGITDNEYGVQVKEASHSESEDLTEIYCDIYNEAIQTYASDSPEMMQSIVNGLGENGYAAVDSENQIDMTGADTVVRFCEKVSAEEEAELTVIVISYSGGLIKYNFKTKDGNVDITREYYQYVDGHMERRSTGNYRADSWQYTEDGYLLFSGRWFSEEYYTLVASEVPECTALRVQPLDEKCRDLNRRYILPIGYGRNNMFIADWCEDDYGELNFYDLFDVFYPLIYGKRVPYTADKNLGVGAVYRIPKEEFEAVIMTYFDIDSETLQSKTTYYPEDATYEYRPRGFYEVGYPELPYPEVVSYAENSDGTITLAVNVVYPHAAVSKAYSHEVVVRPSTDGNFQYVSNQIIPSNDNCEQTWHVPRLTEEEWKEVY